METLGNQKLQKSCNFLICEICDYSTCRKSSYDKHLLTSKHEKQASGNVMETKSCKKLQKVAHISYCCENCNKNFTNRSGLWKHTQKCIVTNEKEHTDKDLIMMLIKENSELKNMVLDVCQKIQPISNTVNSHNVNSNNKTFNLNVFLNETCKDAMNITDFVDSLKLQLSDLENVGEIGYVNGISNIIVKNLNLLEENKRPIHCADKKREILYIKDEDKWEKDEEKKKIRKIIKKVACKNQRLLPEFKKEHPDCGKYHSKYSDQYNKLVVESMGGSGDNDLEKEDKIIRNIAKEVTIDKNIY
jgi:hypothetical protein